MPDTVIMPIEKYNELLDERATLTAQVNTLMKGNEWMQERIMELEQQLARAQKEGAEWEKAFYRSENRWQEGSES